MNKILVILGMVGFCGGVAIAGYPIPTGTAGIDAIRVEQVGAISNTLASASGEVSRERGGVITYFGRDSDALTMALTGRQAGDIFRVPAGTFSVSGLYLVNVTVAGVHPDLTTIETSGVISCAGNATLRDATITATTSELSSLISVTQTNNLVSNVRGNCDAAQHGILIRGVSNRVERVSMYDTGYHGFAVKGIGHRINHCYADSAEYNNLIIKSDNIYPENNPTRDIEIFNFTSVDSQRSLLIETVDDATVADVAIRALRGINCSRLACIKHNHATGTISNVLIDAAADSDTLQEIGSGTTRGMRITNKGKMIYSSDNGNEL